MDNREVAPQLVAVYGSLRSGMGNHRLLAGQRLLVETKTANPYAMYSLGSYPYVRLDRPVNQIIAEVYAVTPECLARLDVLEGYPHYYNRSLVPLESGHEAWMYHIDSQYERASPLVESGDWKLYLQRG